MQIQLADLVDTPPFRPRVRGLVNKSSKSSLPAQGTPDRSSDAQGTSGDASTTQPPGASTTQPPGDASTTQPPGGGSTAQPSGDASATQPLGGASTTQPPGDAGTTQPPGGASATPPRVEVGAAHPSVVANVTQPRVDPSAGHTAIDTVTSDTNSSQSASFSQEINSRILSGAHMQVPDRSSPVDRPGPGRSGDEDRSETHNLQTPIIRQPRVSGEFPAGFERELPEALSQAMDITNGPDT